MGVNRDEMTISAVGRLLHEIGKMVSRIISEQTRVLKADEWEIMQRIRLALTFQPH